MSGESPAGIAQAEPTHNGAMFSRNTVVALFHYQGCFWAARRMSGLPTEGKPHYPGVE
jgi:hypothetical protein